MPESVLLSHLRVLLEDASESLGGVTQRRMFGCDGFFARDNIYGLVWKAGRIGLRLPDAAAFGELASEDGAEPWRAGTMTMSHWLLVPEAFHDDTELLGTWVARAHALAVKTGGSKAKTAAKGGKSTAAKGGKRTAAKGAKKANGAAGARKVAPKRAPASPAKKKRK
jgi:TfoX/Sxy family transcriptional regulator of competence genes